MRIPFIVASIGGREVIGAQWSFIGERENTLKPLDFGNGLFRVHPSQYL